MKDTVIKVGIPPMVLQSIHLGGVLTTHADMFYRLKPTRHEGRRYWVVELPYPKLGTLLEAVYDVILFVDAGRPMAEPQPKVEPPVAIDHVRHWHQAIFQEIRDVQRSVERGDPVTLIGKCAKLLVAPEEPGCPWRQTKAR